MCDQVQNIHDNTELWENRELGASDDHVAVISDEEHAEEQAFIEALRRERGRKADGAVKLSARRKKMSNNVFNDIFGKERAPEHELRYQIIERIRAVIKRHKYTQADLAKILGQKQPYISDLMNGKIGRFSSGKLAMFLTKLGAKFEVKSAVPTKRVVI